MVSHSRRPLLLLSGWLNGNVLLLLVAEDVGVLVRGSLYLRSEGSLGEEPVLRNLVDVLCGLGALALDWRGL